MGEVPAKIDSRCVRVPRGSAEEARRALLAADMLRKDLRPAHDRDFVYLPVKEGEYRGEWPVCAARFKPQVSAPRGYRELVNVPDGLRPLLPRAFDVIGHVIIIKIPDGLLDFRREIGRALLEARPEARSVAMDRGVKGQDRVRELEVVAGLPGLETIHVEHGLKFALDPSRVFFSPRLATERLRVARLVAPGETVLDMFSGVGPFAIHIAKRARPGAVFAADINPVAIAYLERNLRLNRASGVVPVPGDARLLAGILPPADRIVMNLPHSAWEFLPVALRILGPKGTIHLYDLLEPKYKEEKTARLAAAIEGEGRCAEAINARLVRGYSAMESHFVFDVELKGK